MWKIKSFRALLALKRMSDHLWVSRFPLIPSLISYVKKRWYSDYYDYTCDRIKVSLQGFDLLVPRRFVPHYVFNEYEPLTLEVFVKFLTSGMTVVDVGAHIGVFTVIAAKRVGRTGKVHAVEPCLETLELLRANISLNRLENVEVHPFAAGRDHVRRMFNITGSSDSHGFYPHPNIATARTVEVEQVRVDEIVPGRVDAIKIDAEGAEIEVLDGMGGMLADGGHLSLLVEWFPAGQQSAGYDPMELPARLMSLGFKEIRVIDEDAQRICSVEDVASLLRAGSLPTSWYANIWAKR